MTTIDVTTIHPIRRSDAEVIAAAEYARLVEQLRSLDDDDWSRPTDCPLWDVRAMAGHSVGMMGDFTSFRSLLRRMRAATRQAKRTGSPLVDAMTAQQVDEQAELSRGELIERAERLGPKAARWRATAPWPLRSLPVKESVGGVPETWRIGYLLETILTRDPWMHRVDIARATGRPMVLTADHDGRIVGDVVAEWARRHGKPFTLTLTGPAGGVFTSGDGSGEAITIDAVEFCRVLSGRASGSGLLTQAVPF
jgi:uncharacterized protein (TIGR03083 family)